MLSADDVVGDAIADAISPRALLVNAKSGKTQGFRGTTPRGSWHPAPLRGASRRPSGALRVPRALRAQPFLEHEKKAYFLILSRDRLKRSRVDDRTGRIDYRGRLSLTHTRAHPSRRTPAFT